MDRAAAHTAAATMPRIVHIHVEAPPKPPAGQPCNGCGLCCLAEPCPIGMLASRRRQGPCVLLRWDETQRLYRCGAVLPRPARRLPLVGQAPARLLDRLRARLAARWIAAGAGCDADLEPHTLPPR